jgi:hypothetical protein
MNKTLITAIVLGGFVMGTTPTFSDNTYVPPKAELPLPLYGDCDEEYAPAFIASGWMGDIECIEMDQCNAEYPHMGDTCIKVTFDNPRGWGGVVWSDPPNDWGSEPGGWNLTGASNLVIWAKGKKGDEQVEFRMGILRHKEYSDSGFGSTGRVTLGKEWKKYVIPLGTKNLECIKTGFAWAAAGTEDGITFYLDDIQYED